MASGIARFCLPIYSSMICGPCFCIYLAFSPRLLLNWRGELPSLALLPLDECLEWWWSIPSPSLTLRPRLWLCRELFDLLSIDLLSSLLRLFLLLLDFFFFFLRLLSSLSLSEASLSSLNRSLTTFFSFILLLNLNLGRSTAFLIVLILTADSGFFKWFLLPFIIWLFVKTEDFTVRDSEISELSLSSTYMRGSFLL